MNETTKIALVTGANKGIGLEIARQLGELGMTVLVAARDPERGGEAAARLREGGADARFVLLDVGNAESVAAAAKTVEKEFGRLDVLVNNAGITGSSYAPPSELPTEVMRTVYETNVFGVVETTQAFLPLLRRSPAGRIVNMSSDLGSLGLAAHPEYPFRELNYLAYSSSKTALNAVTVAFAKELAGTPVKINSANPGFCATDLNNHSGHRSAEQGARIAVRLATSGEDGPHGGYYEDSGALPW
ncbi:SDR family oxidoreductase [Allokutzneria oryzae]|uniref:SDR family oxidoreductase n=1 Tax=Allokutzneria oryzae TaxID=1378989 RepID=A0ABV6A100_9PSEU